MAKNCWKRIHCYNCFLFVCAFSWDIQIRRLSLLFSPFKKPSRFNIFTFVLVIKLRNNSPLSVVAISFGWKIPIKWFSKACVRVSRSTLSLTARLQSCSSHCSTLVSKAFMSLYIIPDSSHKRFFSIRTNLIKLLNKLNFLKSVRLFYYTKNR